MRPLAAGVLLNERREVLLVQCQHSSDADAWCLPMTPLNRGETLGAAAVRALAERAGVTGQVIRLLDADTAHEPRHGDVLIVTYELAWVEGTATPGTDTNAVRYFPLSSFPQLTLGTIEKALRICAESHLEEWMIRDSFERLQTEDDKVMLSDAMVAMIREHADDITRLWLADLLESPSAPSYRQADIEVLTQRATTALSQFSRWLRGHEAEAELSLFYYNIGQVRREEGFMAHEVISALMLLKKHLAAFAKTHGVFRRPIDVYRVLELNRRVAIFFDKAIFHAARGYEGVADGGSE